MAVGWSGRGPDLLVALDRSDGEPLGRQLQGQIRGAIRDGRLVEGERLPSSRVLAQQLGGGSARLREVLDGAGSPATGGASRPDARRVPRLTGATGREDPNRLSP